MEGRTTIAIAHRLSTIRNASKIVLQRRVVIEETHEKLMGNGGLYCKYWSEQVGRPHSPAVEESSAESDEIQRDETETEEIADDKEEVEKSTGTTALSRSQASVEANTNEVSNDAYQDGGEDNRKINRGEKSEHLELETKHINGDTTPPRTPKSSNTQIRQNLYGYKVSMNHLFTP